MSAACGTWCGFCGACTASWERDDDDRDERPEPVTVRVETRPGGACTETFVGYTADSYAIGELTVTALHTGFDHVFHASEWLHATTYDERGNILFSYDNPVWSSAA